MKLSLLTLSLLVGIPVTANAAPAPSARPAKPTAKSTPAKKSALTPDLISQLDALSVPKFETVPTEFSFAGTQNDLLGMVQSLARGANVANVKPLSSDMNGAFRLFSDADLLGMLSQIHVLSARSLSFRGLSEEAREQALKVPATTKTATVLGGDQEYDREQKLLGDAQKFYAGLFAKQGGREQLTLQNGQTSVAIYGFSSPRSFALLTLGPSRVIVVRADGLPKLDVVGRLFRQIASDQ